MGKINVLSFAVANLIAAGEVVDRPASVIKELLENAIDSGANRITVETQNGGVVFMRVSDNGCGIERDELSIAIRRHATSKIRDASDLDGILTLGFRGEALAAIAAVSDLRIISRVKGQPTGAVIEVSGGDIIGVFDRGCSEGTSVIVENLFGNVPARRKFLKKDITETAAVNSVVEKIALSHPNIAFTYIADGNVKLQTVGDGKLLSTLYALYGRDFAKSLIEVDYQYEGIHVTGYTGRSDNVKPNRNAQNFFINNRLVKSKTVSAAVEQAYSSYIPSDRFAVCTLFVDINPKAVDVNVHPAKLEVKFSNEKPVFEAVYYGIKNALEKNTTRPGISSDKLSHMSYAEYNQLFSPSQVSAPQLENVTERKVSSPQITIAETTNPTVAQKQNKNTIPFIEVKNNVFDNDVVSKLEIEENDYSVESYLKALAERDLNEVVSDEERLEEMENDNAQEKSSQNNSDKLINVSSGYTADDQQQIADQSLPTYKIVGEIFNSYVIVETNDKMLLIDKHAAHERIIFESLKTRLHQSSKSDSQLLMIPLEFMLTSDEVRVIDAYRDEIEHLGFQFETEKYTISVSAIPDAITLDAVPEMFMTMADRMQSNTGNAQLTRDLIFEKALYQASCKAAIKAGREYGPDHVKWIVDKLMTIPDITFCPHGRPVAMEMTKPGIDRQFKRT